MGEKKKSDGENNNNVVLKVDMHCDGCASKIIKYLRAFPGVETVKAESETGKVTITGKVDPTKVKEKLGKKMKKKVELISPQPKNEKENKKDDNKPEKKNNDDKKPKDKEKEPPVTTAVLKVALHCQGCLDKIRKTVKKSKGVHEMSIDEEKDTVTVKGTMDVKALVGNLMEKLKRKVEVVPPKKDKGNNDNKENDGEKEGSGKKKNKGGGGGGGGGDGNNDEGAGKMLMEQNRMEYLPPPHFPFPPFGFGYGPQFPGYGHGGNVVNVGGYGYVPVYPEHLHHAPQMFSDENPNACSVM